MSVEENAGQFKALKENPSKEPVTMLNLLKFKQNGGYEKYMEYLKEANRFVRNVGGKLIYVGKPVELLNGNETWDLLMLVEYPSRQAFLKMINDPEYLKVHQKREEAVERAVLYSMDTVDPSSLGRG